MLPRGHILKTIKKTPIRPQEKKRNWKKRNPQQTRKKWNLLLENLAILIARATSFLHVNFWQINGWPIVVYYWYWKIDSWWFWQLLVSLFVLWVVCKTFTVSKPDNNEVVYVCQFKKSLSCESKPSILN